MRLSRQFSQRAIGFAAAVVTVVIWTSFILVSRASSDPARGATLGPFDIALARILGASVVLLPLGGWLVRTDRARGVGESSLFGFSPLPLRITASIGLFAGLLYALLAYSGFVFAPAGHAAVLLPGSMPLWTALMAAVVLRTRITPPRAVGLALIVAGGALVGGRSLLHAFEGGQVWIGDLLFVAAAIVWSVHSILVRKYALEAVRATTALTAFAFFTYVPVYGALLLLHWAPGRFMAAPMGDIAFQMLFHGLGSVVIAGVTFTRMIQYFGPVRTTMITALVPGLSAFGAVFLLGEPLYWNLAAGLALVTLGIVFGVRPVPASANLRMAQPVAASRRGA
jgi:drug/metabolite transporter (DMT)-like permease